ncbi:MAG: ATP-binding cassette domain-containing protein [Methanobrevibacter sp.]|uniref:ABC transporter ATP-binding protein n=1 Tax=Methanobrevibacter sp. TaxID=66852 RepID=UPI002E7998F7|nr:ATP-binding cassette domain-containing protein [Methanobrevibacter sp.]MEE0943590.1 ATP-binding cassette domain-containing protein [Methanobrevibacter sp.]
MAIIGENGVGKTTLIKLLMRLYDIDSGKITIDGVNINEYDKHSLRSFIGIVLQESWLFSDTIEENIRYGNLESTCDEILTASKQANTDAFIRKLPDKYKTILNEDGTNLSQGQKQLLTIARAIISQKEILVLDEATSNVDTRTELLIQEALDNLMENKTSFIVAHRLATVRNADKIIVLGKGRVIEQGNHEELLAQKGYYYNTLKNQENS